MPEEWIDGTEGDHEEVMDMAGRIELLGFSFGIGDATTLVDPDHESESEIPAGATVVPVVTMDLRGHVHAAGQCLPARSPWVLTSESLDELVEGLLAVQKSMDQRYPFRERRS